MINRIQQVEQWLFILGLPRLDEQEAIWLAGPPTRTDICEVCADLVSLCEQRYKNNYFWPDFSLLGLDECPMPQKQKTYRPRIFVIGVK